jgi:hypothetical protein
LGIPIEETLDNSCPSGMGCAYFGNNSAAERCISPPTDAETAPGGFQRACACNQ